MDFVIMLLLLCLAGTGRMEAEPVGCHALCASKGELLGLRITADFQNVVYAFSQGSSGWGDARVYSGSGSLYPLHWGYFETLRDKGYCGPLKGNALL